MLEKMDDNQLLDILSEPSSDERKVQTLKEATQDNQDNHSAILVHLLPKVSSRFPGGRKSVLTIIVALAVLVAAVLLILKLI